VSSVPTDDQDNTRPDPTGARVVVFSPDLAGCSSFSDAGIKSALANLAMVRRLWIDGPIQSKETSLNQLSEGTRHEHLSD